MLDKPLRAPSKDALRFLRHVVLYSSFGTVAGTTVLLAEERRRRICLAKKIIENGKRIKSSDRHVHSVALAERSDGGYAEQYADPPPVSPHLFPLKDVRSPYSPSEIDKAYQSTHNRPGDVQKGVWRALAREENVQQARVDGDLGLVDGKLRDNSTWRGKDRDTKREAGRRAANVTTIATGDEFFSERYPESIRTFTRGRMERAVAAGDTSKCLEYFYHYYKRDTHLLEVDSAPTKRLCVESGVAPTLEETTFPIVQSDELRDRVRSNLKNEDLVEVIRVFFHLFPAADRFNSAQEDVAYFLLDVSVEQKSFYAIEKLFLWMKRRGILRAEQVQQIFLKLSKTLTRRRWIAKLLLLTRVLPKEPRESVLPFSVDFMRTLFDAALAEGREIDVAGSWRGRVAPDTFVSAWTSAVLAKAEFLLTTQRADEATALFVDTMHTEWIGALNPESLEMARRLLDAAWLSGKTSAAENILCWAESYNARTTLFEQSVEVYLKQKAYALVIRVYGLYRAYIAESPKLYSMVCQAFVKSAVLSDAIEFVEDESKKSKNVDALRIRQNSYPVLLRRLWGETHDFGRVQALLARLQSWAGPEPLPLEVYNAMILTSVEASRPNDAKHYLRLMGQHGLKPDQKTLGHVMLASAMNGDWTNVTNILDHAHRSGILQSVSRHWESFFQPILHEYCKHHDASQVEAFVTKAVSKYGLQLDESTSNTVLKVFVKSQQPSQIVRWMESLRSWGFKPQLDARSVVVLFKRYTLSYRPDARSLMRLAVRLSRLKTSIASKQLYSVVRDGMSYDLGRARTQNSRLTHWSGARYLNHVNQLRRNAPRLPVDAEGTSPAGKFPTISRQQKELESDIMLAESLDKPAEAVNTYRRSRASGLIPSSIALKMAVEASIRANSGNTGEAMDIIMDAQAAGLNSNYALTPLVINHIEREKVTEAQLRASVMDYYSRRDQHKLHIDHAVAVSAANRLINQRNPDAAIGLLTVVWDSEYAKRYPFDIVAMTVFLKAYAARGSLAGIRWVVHTVLSKNMRIDTSFCRALKEARKPFQTKQHHEPHVYAGKNATGVIWHWMQLVQQRKAVQQQVTEQMGSELVRIVKELSMDLPRKERARLNPRKGSKWRVYTPRMQRRQKLSPKSRLRVRRRRVAIHTTRPDLKRWLDSTTSDEPRYMGDYLRSLESG